MGSVRLNDKRVLKDLRELIQGGLDKLGADVAFDLGSCRYESDGDSCTFKLTVTAAGAENREAKDMKSMLKTYSAYGLKPSDLGASFNHRGARFAISGFSARSRKYRVLATDRNGKVYKFSEKHVARELGRTGPASEPLRKNTLKIEDAVGSANVFNGDRE